MSPERHVAVPCQKSWGMTVKCVWTASVSLTIPGGIIPLQTWSESFEGTDMYMGLHQWFTATGLLFFFSFLFHLPLATVGGKKTLAKRNRLFKRLKSGMVAFWSFSLRLSLFLLQSQNQPWSCQSYLSLIFGNEWDHGCLQILKVLYLASARCLFFVV